MTLPELRQAFGLTQVDLDDAAGLKRGTVTQIENGRNLNPSIKVCLAIVEAFRARGAKDLAIEDLFGHETTAKT